MKTSLTLLLAIMISVATSAQSYSGQPDLAGVWYMTKDQKTVVLYPKGSAYDILPFDMDRQQISGDAIAQCIFLKKSYFRIIGLLADDHGNKRPIKCWIDFNGVDKIKANGNARFYMTLIKRLSAQEMVAIVHGNSAAPTRSPNFSGDAGIPQTQVTHDQLGVPASLPQLLPNQGSGQQNDPMASLNNGMQRSMHPANQAQRTHASSTQQSQYIPQQNTVDQRQPIQFNPQPTMGTQQQIGQYSQPQNSNRNQQAAYGPGQNNAQYQQPRQSQQPNYSAQSYPQNQANPYGQTAYPRQNNYMQPQTTSASGQNIAPYQQPMQNNLQPNYPVQTYPQGQFNSYAQSGYLPQGVAQTNSLVQQPEKPKRKKKIGKKIFKGLGTVLEIAGDLGVVPGLGMASKLVNKIGQ